MNAQPAELEGVVIDESHHISSVVWSSAVEHLAVNQDDAGSNPVTPPTTSAPSVERFTGPLRLRSYQIDALRQLRGRPLFRPAVAQMVERRPEELGVAGSIPARGTALKLKL